MSLTSLHYYLWAMTVLVRWTVFTLVAAASRAWISDMADYFAIADRDDLSYGDEEHVAFADDYFETERYLDFLLAVAQFLDEVVLEWVDSLGLRRAAAGDGARDLPGGRARPVRGPFPRAGRAVGDRREGAALQPTGGQPREVVGSRGRTAVTTVPVPDESISRRPPSALRAVEAQADTVGRLPDAASFRRR